MIKIQYVSEIKTAQRFCSCNACGKSSQDDPKMIQVHFQDGSGFGVIVCLCDECRRELYEKI